MSRACTGRLSQRAGVWFRPRGLCGVLIGGLVAVGCAEPADSGAGAASPGASRSAVPPLAGAVPPAGPAAAAESPPASAVADAGQPPPGTDAPAAELADAHAPAGHAAVTPTHPPADGAPTDHRPGATHPPQHAGGSSAHQPAGEKKGSIVGRKTHDVRDAAVEKAKGAQVTKPRITSRDPITLTGNAYVTIVSRAAQLQIKQAVNLFHGENGRYPRDFDEFKSQVLDKNSIRLPVLPAYQGYGYDAATHELLVLEYPDKKAAMGIP